MWFRTLMWRIVASLLVLASCSASTATESVDQLGDVSIRETIRIPLTLYVVDEAGDGESIFSSQRSTEGVAIIADDMSEIWGQADIVFDPVRVHQIEVPPDALRGLVIDGGTDRLFDQAGRTFETPDVGVINGFYLIEAAGYNGFTPDGSRVFFVADEPTVLDERVSSHEVGHILGLGHEPDDPMRLMYSGTNGKTLTKAEQDRARQRAQEILDETK